MVLYELICITRRQLNNSTLKEIARTAGATVINNGGVIRKIQNLGLKTLPKPIKKYQDTHLEANYFLMCFDTNRKRFEERGTNISSRAKGRFVDNQTGSSSAATFCCQTWRKAGRDTAFEIDVVNFQHSHDSAYLTA